MASHRYFLSDLHLFSRRSQAERHVPAIQATAAAADCLILGGDIFDFRWSHHRSAERTTQAAMGWLDDLVGSHSQCDFHFVLGNHDSNARFVTALNSYRRQRPNLHVHPYLFRDGANVFLHGDAADRPAMCDVKLIQHRRPWEHDEQRGEVQNLLYDLAVATRLHKVAGKIAHPRRRVAERLRGYLAKLGHSPETGLKQVYFGHTHEALHHYQHAHLAFHNGGAPIAGLDFRIVKVS